MATIGDQILEPEEGWKRYDNEERLFYLVGEWVLHDNISAYNGTGIYSNTFNAKINFKFKGTKLRFISRNYDKNYESIIQVWIDGLQVGTFIQNQGVILNQVIQYEITGLEDKIHNVEIKKDGSDFMYFDAIDIDDNGRLYHPFLDEVFNIQDLDVGKCIRCHYTANSNQLGVFNNLGQETSDLISPTSSATPNGDFYWICVGYDTQGRKKIIADRNIQHSISWDTLNNAGVVNGLDMKIDNLTDCDFTTRLLTDGIDVNDKDNEWDKIIVESDLNSTITAGDNNVWHWNNIAFWTSTTDTSNATYRVIRGGGTSDTSVRKGISPTTINTSTGFRPILLIDTPSPQVTIDINALTQISLKITDKDGDNFKYKVEHLNTDGTVKQVLAEQTEFISVDTGVVHIE